MAELKDVVWSQSGFDDLKKYCHKNNDFLREAANLFHERAKLEIIYSDGLQKIGTKARKICMETLGTLRIAWEEFSTQTDLEASVHKARSTEILDEISKPLKTFADAQKESRKPAEHAVEKALKTLADKRLKESQAKKTSYSKAKDSETLTVQLETARSKTLTDKELSKLDSKCKKAEENVTKSDNDYITKILDAERARLELESSIASATIVYQELEEERVAYFKKTLQTYCTLMLNSTPKVEEHIRTIEKSANEMNIKADLQTLIETRGSPKMPAEQVVFSCYEEDMNNAMDSTRRKLALEHKLDKLQRALQGEKKAKKGLVRLNSVYQDTPSFSTKNTQQSVGFQLGHASSVINLLEASMYRLQIPLSKITNGRPVDHRLSKYISERKDKQGSIHCILRVPVDESSNGVGDGGDDDDDDHEYMMADDYSKQATYEAYHKSSVNQTYGGGEDEDSDIDPDFDDDIVDVAPPGYAAIDMCKVDYEYIASENDELTIQPGDVITIVLRHDDGWWKGELRGKVGLFPASYVHELK